MKIIAMCEYPTMKSLHQDHQGITMCIYMTLIRLIALDNGVLFILASVPVKTNSMSNWNPVVSYSPIYLS